MAAEIVNLNKHRKAKARLDKAARADANAVKFGRSKSEKLRDQLISEKQNTHLDGHKRDDRDDPTPPCKPDAT